MENRPFSSPKAQDVGGRCTVCTDGQTSSATTRRSFDLNAGKSFEQRTFFLPDGHLLLCPSLVTNESISLRWEYLPFSGGPRICIGQQFALTQMSYLVTRLLQTFDEVEAVDDGPMLQEVSTTMKIVGGCWVKMRAV